MPRLAAPLFALALLLLAAGAARDAFDRWIERTDLPVLLPDVSVELRDRTGRMLRAYPVADGLMRLQPGAVDPGFVELLVRYEDKRFWHHTGVDVLALTRAAGQALWHGRAVSGGSTLTMQVARLLEDGSTGRWTGKLRQIRVALAMERNLDKQRILSLYLTHAPYGGNLEGIRAATLAWFGKEPRRLTHAEAALLVALPQAPETRRPDRFPDRARAARDRVLTRMQAHGMLTQGATAAATRDPVPARMRRFPRLAPHLTDRVVAETPEALRHDLTLDAGVQDRMERLAARAAATAGPSISAALLVADHTTGSIIASVGSPGYRSGRQGFVDMTRAVRSPGSTLKPLVYGLAFDQGLAHPETLIHDGPVSFGRYAPRNFDGQFRGDVRVRDALQLSLNIPVVRLTETLGPARIMSALWRSGAEPQVRGVPGLAIALGGVGMSLHELVQLYAGIAQGGKAVPLRSIAGQALDDTSRVRILSPEAAWQIGDILSGLPPPPGAPRRALAYKTGTSYGHRDAWAIGYDGQHVIGVWMGRADGTPVPGAFGGDLAAPVLFEAFGLLKTGFSHLPPPPPATLIIGAAQLPEPLKRFRPRDTAHRPDPGLELLFPPDGAHLAGGDAPLTIKLRGGAAPYTVLVNGKPMAADLRAREFSIPSPGAGYSTLVVLDAQGRADRAAIRLD